MGNSLSDQLLKAGLVDKKKVKQVSTEKRKNAKQKRSKSQAPENANSPVKQRNAEKIARDRELNQQRAQAQQRKAVSAQIKQLIEHNRVALEEGEIRFNFEDDKVIKTIFITDNVRRLLSRGSLAVVKHEGKYDLVPKEIAEKIADRDQRCVVLLHASDDKTDGDDPYADFQVPDDLIW